MNLTRLARENISSSLLASVLLALAGPDKVAYMALGMVMVSSVLLAWDAKINFKTGITVGVNLMTIFVCFSVLA